jgi:hypothetical protein
MPEASRRVAGGTRESTGRERQTTAAAAEHPPATSERLACSVFHEPPYAERHVRWCGRWEPQCSHIPDRGLRRRQVWRHALSKADLALRPSWNQG